MTLFTQLTSLTLLTLMTLFDPQGVQDDVKTLQTNLKSVNLLWNNVLCDAEPTFKAEVGGQVTQLNQDWDKLVSKT